MKQRFQRLSHHLNRNVILFTGGLLGVGHETLLQHAERPTLLILFAAMMGLPAFLNPGGEGLGHKEVASNEGQAKHDEKRE